MTSKKIKNSYDQGALDALQKVAGFGDMLANGMAGMGKAIGSGMNSAVSAVASGAKSLGNSLKNKNAIRRDASIAKKLATGDMKSNTSVLSNNPGYGG